MELCHTSQPGSALVVHVICARNLRTPNTLFWVVARGQRTEGFAGVGQAFVEEIPRLFAFHPVFPPSVGSIVVDVEDCLEITFPYSDVLEYPGGDGRAHRDQDALRSLATRIR